MNWPNSIVVQIMEAIIYSLTIACIMLENYLEKARQIIRGLIFGLTVLRFRR